MKRSISVLLAVIIAASALCTLPATAENADPAASYTHVNAPYEDSGIDLWFDYASHKVAQSSAVSTGMETFSVYMAKNEIEDCQFFLSSADGRSDLDAAVTQFTNESGDTIDTSLYIEYYHDCGTSGMLPDAIPPLERYGSFDLAQGSSQGFVIRLKTVSATPSGWYSATLNVTDSASHTVKTATVYAYVWNYELSDETQCATSVNLSYDYLSRVCSTETASATELYKNYYDYLLDNRVSAYYLPYGMQTASAKSYMENPRVTSYQFGTPSGTALNDTVYTYLFSNLFANAENADLFEKAYYFSNIVDAAAPADLERLYTAYQTFYNKVGKYQPSYSDIPFNFITTYINDIDYTTAGGETIDQIQYYSDFVNLWCSKTFAFTDPAELTTPGAKILQNQKWDSVYGSFKSRMAAKQAAGQKVWWFISWDVTAPYINYYMQTSGTAQRILFWQQYDNGVEGFLYNFANFWTGNTADPYAANITDTRYPDAHGESILLYPGDVYGMDTPVGSLRLEAMRDGIEDYQMFYMLDAKCGDGTADAYIDRMTTGMVTYSTDDASYYQARLAAGNALEAASSVCSHEYSSAVTTPATCTVDGVMTYTCTACGNSYTETVPATGHSYSAAVTTPATCTEAGVKTYTCSACGDSYTEAIPAAGHSYVNGVCSVCEAIDPEYAYLKGDINNDTLINGKDGNLMVKICCAEYFATALEQEAADVLADGIINGKDANKLVRFLNGTISTFD